LKEDKPIIVDTNIIFCSLLRKGSPFYELLLTTDYQFYTCELTVVEIFKHKEKIVKLSELSEEEIIKFYHQLLKRLNLFKEDLIETHNWNEAYRLCKDIDETDTPFIALVKQLDGLLFTGDKILKDGLAAKRFTSFFEHKKSNDT